MGRFAIPNPLLRIIIDWKLNFNEHVKLLCAKANAKVKTRSKLDPLYRLRSKLDPRQKSMLYNSFLMSNLNYCPIIWMFYGKTSDEKINNIHKRALRALYNDSNSNYYELLKKGNHLNIHEMNKRRLLVEVYECINKDNPPILNDNFTSKENGINIRINNKLALPKVTTQRGLHSFTFRRIRAWNTLSDDQKNMLSQRI